MSSRSPTFLWIARCGQAQEKARRSAVVPVYLAGACTRDAARRLDYLAFDRIGQHLGPCDDTRGNECEQRRILDRGNAAPVIPELCQKLFSLLITLIP